MGKAGKNTRLPRVRYACFQQFPALGAEVEVSCHC
jgi:hypothetical protein